jgi:hypothetical protein
MDFLLMPLFVALGGQTPPPAQPRPVTPAPLTRPATPLTYPSLPDPGAAIATAVRKAALDDIRVLVNWGTNDDRGRAFAKALTSAEVRATRFNGTEYKVVNVDVGKLDRHVDLAARYGAVLQPDHLPALTVLDDTGKAIAQASASEFRSGKSPTQFDSARIAAFFKRHQAPAPDAIAPFEAAVRQAKQDGRTVFVWFTAPT